MSLPARARRSASSCANGLSCAWTGGPSTERLKTANRDGGEHVATHVYHFTTVSNSGQGTVCAACHSRARRCASLRSAGVIRSATRSRKRTDRSRSAPG